MHSCRLRKQHTTQCSQSFSNSSSLTDEDRRGTEQLGFHTAASAFSLWQTVNGGGGQKDCSSEGESAANLDGPLAIHSRGIETGVKWRGKDSFVVRQYTSASFN